MCLVSQCLRSLNSPSITKSIAYLVYKTVKSKLIPEIPKEENHKVPKLYGSYPEYGYHFINQFPGPYKTMLPKVEGIQWITHLSNKPDYKRIQLPVT